MVLEVGFPQVTVEGIAARAGVGKATIYRWWPSKARLVIEAFLESSGDVLKFEDRGSLKEDLRHNLYGLIELFSSPHGRIIANVIGAAQGDPELATSFLEGWLMVRRRQTLEMFERARERGEINGQFEHNTVIDAIYGAVYYRLLIGHLPLEPKMADELVDGVASHVFGSVG